MQHRLYNKLLLLLTHFSRIQLCVTPETAAHQAPPSLGFSRQEHWSGLPFPSPMHESEKWKVKGKSLSPVRLFVTPWTAAYQAPPSMGFSRQEYWSGGAIAFLLYTYINLYVQKCEYVHNEYLMDSKDTNNSACFWGKWESGWERENFHCIPF